jgi:hypothetical protein
MIPRVLGCPMIAQRMLTEHVDVCSFQAIKSAWAIFSPTTGKIYCFKCTRNSGSASQGNTTLQPFLEELPAYGVNRTTIAKESISTYSIMFRICIILVLGTILGAHSFRFSGINNRIFGRTLGKCYSERPSTGAYDEMDEESDMSEYLDDGDGDDLSKSMAMETFKELSLHTDSLSVQAFMDWDDIKDTIANGLVDESIVKMIIKEAGIKTGFMSFEQFTEVVGEELLTNYEFACVHI